MRERETIEQRVQVTVGTEVGGATACRLLVTLRQTLRPPPPGCPPHLTLLDTMRGREGEERREEPREQTEHSQASMMSCG